MIRLKHYGKGKPKTLLMLHSGNVSSWMWKESIELLSKEHHCIVLDLPGHGENKSMDFDIKRNANMIVKILNKVVPEKKVHVLGVGIGGQVALELAYEYPHLIESVILSGTLMNPKTFRFYHKWKLSFKNSFRSTDMAIKSKMRKLGIPAEYKNEMVKETLYLPKDRLLQITKETKEFTLPEDGQILRVPAMIMVGEHESYDIRVSAKEIAKYFYYVQKVEIAEGKALWMIDKPAVLNRMVTKFIDKQHVYGELDEEVKSHEILETEAVIS